MQREVVSQLQGILHTAFPPHAIPAAWQAPLLNALSERGGRFAEGEPHFHTQAQQAHPFTVSLF